MAMGYFVVFLRGMKKNVVLPASWIKDIGSHFAKFINNSLNQSQKFVCYFPETSSHAFDDNGRPSGDIEPDFRHSTKCFTGKLKRYFGKEIKLSKPFYV